MNFVRSPVDMDMRRVVGRLPNKKSRIAIKQFKNPVELTHAIPLATRLPPTVNISYRHIPSNPLGGKWVAKVTPKRSLNSCLMNAIFLSFIHNPTTNNINSLEVAVF